MGPDKGTDVHFECMKCGACCSHEQLIVTLTGTDISRLSRTLDLDAHQMMRVLDFYVLGPNDPVPEGLTHIPSVETENGKTYVALRKTPDGKCVFLDEKLCMIHPVRPDACRSFPFFFRRDDGRLSWGLSAMRDICPGLGEGPEVTTSELIVLGERVTLALDAYRKIATEWCSQGREHTALALVKHLLQE